MKSFFLLALAASSAQATYWMESIKHQGKASFNPDKSYQIFRNVKNFGAKGDGVTDDTDAINKAISTGNRCGGGNGCQGTTTTPAVVYFPPGTYLISSSIIDYYYTQLIGDANNLPVLKGTPGFVKSSQAMGLIDSDPYGPNGQKQFTATNVFFRQVRNMIFDLTDVQGKGVGIHWPSSQATSIQNCIFKMSDKNQSEHTGIFMEEGSGGLLNDLVFYGGKYGAQFGNQQYTTRNLTFHGSATAIQQLWDWGWTYKSLSINNCDVGINMSSTAVGSVTVVDSSFVNVTKAIITGRRPSNNTGQGSLVIENVHYDNVPTVLEGPGDQVLLQGYEVGPNWDPGYAMGRLYAPRGLKTPYSDRDPVYFSRPSPLVDKDGKFYERSKPQYSSTPASLFLSARTFGAAGDGIADDTHKLNALFKAAAAAYAKGAVAFLDAGLYRVTDTVVIPPNVRIVGEAMAAVIMGSGAKFANMNAPHSVVRIGKPGDAGYIEMSDIIVSTQGPTAGAVLIEYNLNTPTEAGATGTGRPSGLWDVHARVGGFAGSDLQVAQCQKTPKTPDLVRPECIAAYLSMHVTKSASNLYMEGNWLWAADHDIEDFNNTQISVFAGRGLLIESTAGRVWLVGTAVEHHTLYQYQLRGTRDIWMGQIQTETPYYQPSPQAPAPFIKRDVARGDPDFASDCQEHKSDVAAPSNTSALTDTSALSPCAMAWGLRIVDSRDISVYGAGLYSFFNNYNTSCSSFSAGEICQARIFSVEDAPIEKRAGNDNATAVMPKNNNIVVYNLNTVGAATMATHGAQDAALWRDNFATFASTIVVMIL